MQGLQPIVEALHDRFPSRPVVLSTFTFTGKAMAQALVPQAERVFLLPLDLPWTVGKLVRRLSPGALIVQETELWPNLFRSLGRLQIPIVVVNGRLSSPLLSKVRCDPTLHAPCIGQCVPCPGADRRQCAKIPAPWHAPAQGEDGRQHQH